MRYQTIFEAGPTVDNEQSLRDFFELLAFSEWRTYSSETRLDIEILINEFVSRWAEVPGLVTETTTALRPMRIVDGKSPKFSVRGGIYINGAFFEISNHLGERNILLMLSEAVAKEGDFPVDGYIHAAEHFLKSDATPNDAL